MTTHQLVDSAPDTRRSPWNRLAAGSGAAFVVLTFAGNSLTESAVSTDSGGSAGEAALGALAAKAASGTARLGVAMELAGFLAFAVFAVTVAELVRRRGAAGIASGVALVAATVMLAVKLGSGAPYVAGLTHHAALAPDTALVLIGSNDAGFVLCWLPFGAFLVAAALALRAAGLVGRLTVVTGALAGALAVLASAVGVADATSANPLPFLLGCLWALVVSMRLAWSGRA